MDLGLIIQPIHEFQDVYKRQGTEIKQVMNGIAELVITYEDVEDVITQIAELDMLRG